MKLGIIQGRLTVPKEGHQTTPENWQNEFKLINKLSLNHIEWNLNKEKLLNNPLFTCRINSVYLQKISSVCFDNAVSELIFDYDYFYSNVLLLIPLLKEIGINRITLPLVEEARLNSDEDVEKVKNYLYLCGEINNKLIINIESDSEIYYTQSLLNYSKNINFTYDTGNLTAERYEHEEYLKKTIYKITNIHLKDRIYGGNSVSNFEGNTNFDLIFRTLAKFKYDNLFTLQMARGETGKEEDIVKYYRDNFKDKYALHF